MSNRSRQIMFLGVKCGRCIGLTSLPPSVSRLSRQCGILNISQPYRPPQPVTGIALLFLPLQTCTLSACAVRLGSAVHAVETPVSTQACRAHYPRESVKFRAVVSDVQSSGRQLAALLCLPLSTWRKLRAFPHFTQRGDWPLSIA
jgi:hypothetical protein